MSIAVESAQVAQPYSLSFIQTMVAKIAPSIDTWLPEAVHISLQDLESVVSQIAHAPPPSRQYNRGGRHRQGGFQMSRSNFGSGNAKASGRPEWSNENWDNFMSPGSLSRYLLWNKKTLSASIADYKKNFNLG